MIASEQSTANITMVGLNYKVVGSMPCNRSSLPTMKYMTPILVLTFGILCHLMVRIFLPDGSKSKIKSYPNFRSNTVLFYRTLNRADVEPNKVS